MDSMTRSCHVSVKQATEDFILLEHCANDNPFCCRV